MCPDLVNKKAYTILHDTSFPDKHTNVMSKVTSASMHTRRHGIHIDHCFSFTSA